jgi:hypothetical protein
MHIFPLPNLQFGADIRLLLESEAVRVTEDDLREGGTSTRIMDNLLDYTTSVTMTLGEVEGSELSGVLYHTQDSSVPQFHFQQSRRGRAFLSLV